MVMMVLEGGDVKECLSNCAEFPSRNQIPFSVSKVAGESMVIQHAPASIQRGQASLCQLGLRPLPASAATPAAS